jgi:nucleotide-binding universal stress UspA family protein
MLYKKILVAVDGSEGSFVALHNGIEIARNTGSELTLLYVTNEIALPLYGGIHPGGMGMTGTSAVRNKSTVAELAEESHGEEILNIARRRVDPEIRATSAILHGDPPATICAYADSHNIDLIVIGNRGHSGLKRLFLGSVSQKVVSGAHQPVLVAK